MNVIEQLREAKTPSKAATILLKWNQIPIVRGRGLNGRFRIAAAQSDPAWADGIMLQLASVLVPEGCRWVMSVGDVNGAFVYICDAVTLDPISTANHAYPGVALMIAALDARGVNKRTIDFVVYDEKGKAKASYEDVSVPDTDFRVTFKAPGIIKIEED